MDKRVFLIVLLFLFACESELPPSPPVPGGSLFGNAIGGIAISPAVLPAWAAPILYTDISPTLVRDGNTITITISKDYLNASTDKKFYAYAAMYVYNKNSRVWEKFIADSSASGKITRDWAENKATFIVPANSPRFAPGSNFIITYWCLDTGVRDGQGYKIWNCNGRRWGLGSFEMQGPGFPNILIENNIGTNIYRNSTQRQTSEGLEYEALYDDASGTTSVKVVQLNNVTAYHQSLADNLPFVESLWSSLVNTCGFYQPELRKFTYLSGSNRVTVQTFGAALDTAKVSAYNLRYVSECGLLDDLRRVVSGVAGLCGNSVVESGEACDNRNDSGCPGACRPDCSCSLKGPANAGGCGDFKIQTPNSQGVVETCEPPEVRDVQGQLRSGSLCFLRDPLSGALNGSGHCDAQCKCVSGFVALPKCGNGNCESDESFISCPADCPPESNPPNITIVTPLPGQVFNTTGVVYTIIALDDSGVASCTASTDGGPKETMTVIGSAWKLTKLFSAGTHGVLFECTDVRQNTRNVPNAFSVVLPAAQGDITVFVRDQQNASINGTNVTLYNSTFGVLGTQVTNPLCANFGICNQETVLFSPVQYGEYYVGVTKQDYLPAMVPFSLVTPSLSFIVYLSDLPVVNPPEVGNQSCVVPITNQGLVSSVSHNADDYCAGFEDLTQDIIMPPVFIDNTGAIPNGIPNLRPQGMFDAGKQNLICTIPCAVVVKNRCLDNIGYTGANYNNNLVRNYACSGN